MSVPRGPFSHNLSMWSSDIAVIRQLSGGGNSQAAIIG